eukprot:5123216-Prymnesium_polylepis.1
MLLATWRKAAHPVGRGQRGALCILVKTHLKRLAGTELRCEAALCAPAPCGAGGRGTAATPDPVCGGPGHGVTLTGHPVCGGPGHGVTLTLTPRRFGGFGPAV